MMRKADAVVVTMKVKANITAAVIMKMASIIAMVIITMVKENITAAVIMKKADITVTVIMQKQFLRTEFRH